MKTKLIHFAALVVTMAGAIAAAPTAQAGPLPMLCIAPGAGTPCLSYDNGGITRPLHPVGVR